MQAQGSDSRTLGEASDSLRQEFGETRIILSIPNRGLGLRKLTSILRAFELLVCLRAMSPRGQLDDAWHRLYREFLRATSQQKAESENLRSLGGARAPMFELWLQRLAEGKQLLPLEKIDQGSYEFVCQALNLAAVFGLQDYALLKDVIQWSTSAVAGLVKFEPDSENDPYTTRQTRGTHAETVRSGPSAAVLLTPEMVRAFRDFDSVEFTEETKIGVRKLRIKLVKTSGASTSAEL